MSNTSELEALNTMLSAIAVAPISSLTGNQLSPEVNTAKNILTEIHRAVLSIGWGFNSETKVTLTPNSTDSRIGLDENILHVDVTDTYNTDVDVVQRGNLLYDKKNHTYAFSEALTADTVIHLGWETLPEVCRRYIMIKAARTLVDRMDGQQAAHAFSLQDEGEAMVAMKKHDAKSRDTNLLQGNWSTRRVINRRSVISGIN